MRSTRFCHGFSTFGNMALPREALLPSHERTELDPRPRTTGFLAWPAPNPPLTPSIKTLDPARKAESKAVLSRDTKFEIDVRKDQKRDIRKGHACVHTEC